MRFNENEKLCNFKEKFINLKINAIKYKVVKLYLRGGILRGN